MTRDIEDAGTIAKGALIIYEHTVPLMTREHMYLPPQCSERSREGDLIRFLFEPGASVITAGREAALALRSVAFRPLLAEAVEKVRMTLIAYIGLEALEALFNSLPDKSKPLIFHAEEHLRPEHREQLREAVGSLEVAIQVAMKDEGRSSAPAQESAPASTTPSTRPRYRGAGDLLIRGQVYQLSERETKVVEAFRDGPLGKADLERVVENGVQVLKRLRTKYPKLAPHVRMPGRANRGGYALDIDWEVEA